MSDEQKPLVFIDREGKPGGEGFANKQRADLYLEWIKTELVGVGDGKWKCGC